MLLFLRYPLRRICLGAKSFDFFLKEAAKKWVFILRPDIFNWFPWRNGRKVSSFSSRRFLLVIDTNKAVAGKSFSLSVVRIKITGKNWLWLESFSSFRFIDDAIMIFFSPTRKSKQIASNYIDDDLFFYRAWTRNEYDKNAVLIKHGNFIDTKLCTDYSTGRKNLWWEFPSFIDNDNEWFN